MSKRKDSHREEKTGKLRSEKESSSDDDADMLDVDFEFFDPQPQVDFLGLKTLLRQLLDIDAQLIDLSALADLILEQPLLGSTVKVDGNESDPYAFLTVLNIHEHKEKPVIKDLVEYLKVQTAKNTTLYPISSLLGPSSDAQVGLILTERLINVPSEVVPPMYKMLLEEISWALEEKEPYTFTHYLLLSKTYLEVQSLLDQEEHRPQKKKKGVSNADIFYFHPEDEVIHEHALAYGSIPYVKEDVNGSSDSKRAFQEMGIKPQGHMILIEASKFESMVKALEDYMGAS